MASELTIRDLMKRHGWTRRQAEYRIERAGIEPTRRVGMTRLFDSAQVERLELSHERGREAAQQ